MFGWMEFRRDGKYRRENVDFLLFGKGGKWEGVENQEKTFSPGPQIFVSPIREEKLGEKFSPSIFTFAPTHLIFILYFVFIFWFCIDFTKVCEPSSLLTTFLWVECSVNLLTTFLLVTKSFAQLNLYVHYCNFYIIPIKIII